MKLLPAKTLLNILILFEIAIFLFSLSFAIIAFINKSFTLIGILYCLIGFETIGTIACLGVAYFVNWFWIWLLRILHFIKLLWAIVIVAMNVADLIIYRRILLIDVLILSTIGINFIYRIGFVIVAATIIYKTNVENVKETL